MYKIKKERIKIRQEKQRNSSQHNHMILYRLKKDLNFQKKFLNLLQEGRIKLINILGQMFDLKNKYTISVKTSYQNFTIKSTLKPDLSKFNLTSQQIVWYRQPPAPYQIEELSFNVNKVSYKCSSLDFQCSIICKVISQQTGQMIDRFDFGPIETFLFNRSSPINEFRVNLALFGNYKKCIFTCNPTPTLINPVNNNKYTLTQQDIRSIYFLNQEETIDPQQQDDNPDPSRLSTSSAGDKTKFITNKLRKTIVVGNLFQRLILLKLFHQIPNGMYCHSTELLEIIFYDETSCNMALMALNRFKYMKKQQNQISKSMFNTLQQSVVTKIMKKSNDSFSNLNTIKTSQHHSKSSADQSFHSSTKKEFLPLAMLKSLKKSPKQSINSVHQSLASKNSNRMNQSKILTDHQQSRLNMSLLQNQSKETLRYAQNSSRLSIKHPKISILSTDINSTKQPRQKKVSFPQTPNIQNLKSSELIIKPNQFKSCLSLRRSQQQIKTPRMDADDQVNISSIKGPIKKKSISVIQDPDETQEECKYVNQFQNLLFQVQDSQAKEQLCLNDSFAKLQEQEQKEKSKFLQSAQKAQLQNQIDKNQNISQFLPSIVNELYSQAQSTGIHSLKQTLQSVLNENQELKRKNQLLKKQIEEINTMGGKRDEIQKYQNQIESMKEIKLSLIREIQNLKYSACSIKNQSSQKQLKFLAYSPQRNDHNHYGYQTDPKNVNNFVGSIQKKKIPSTQNKGLILHPRQSKFGNQHQFKYAQPPSPTFAGRRSQQHGCPSFILKQDENQGANKNANKLMNSGELKFFKLQNDQAYMKFRTNQSYSYKTAQTFKFDNIGFNKP